MRSPSTWALRMKLVLGSEWFKEDEEEEEDTEDEEEDRLRSRRKFISQLEDGLVSEGR